MDPQRQPAPHLLLIAPAPVMRLGDRVRLDVKFVEGMRAHTDAWPGPVSCILREGAGQIPYGVEADPAALGFMLHVLPEGGAVAQGMLAGADVVMLSGDDADNLPLAARARAGGAKTCFSLEYTLQTRLRIAWLDRSRSLPRRLYSLLWTLRKEPSRRRALALCDAAAANGYPAYHACRVRNPNTLLYLDNRMTPALFATEAEMEARAARLASGAPLRLIYSGRLERLKGAQDLVPLAKALRKRALPFTLDIFGTGSLDAPIRQEVAKAGLGDTVRLRGAVDFASALVPFKRREADLFIAPHRQGDPSCTYIEAMGCGLPVIGYGNEMWRALNAASGAGWAVPLGRIEALAEAIATAHGDREKLNARARAAHSFARAHDFETEFGKRMAQLRALVGAARP